MVGMSYWSLVNADCLHVPHARLCVLCRYGWILQSLWCCRMCKSVGNTKLGLGEILFHAFVDCCVNSVLWLKFPLPKYKVSGIYKPQICRKLAARLRLIVAARLRQTRFSYANYFSGALLLHTMCATRMQRTVVAHCSGTQCASQVCGAQLSRTVLVHNVRHKFAAHNCRALFWYTMCAASLQRTVVAHCSVCHNAHTVAVHCAVPPPPPPPPQPPVYLPTPIYFFSSLPPGGVWEKMWGWLECYKNLGVGMGKNVGVGGWYGLSEK